MGRPQGLAWGATDLELFLGSSHQCQRCGYSFLAHEDGCPRCGASDGYVMPIHRDIPEPAEGEEVILCTITTHPDGRVEFTGGPESPPPKQP